MALALVLALHALMAVIWVGGMIFAVCFLRPAVAAMPPAERLRLWQRVLGRFLPTLLIVILILLISGYWTIFNIFGGFDGLGLAINLMQGLGWIMVLIFLHAYFARYLRFRRALAADDMPGAGRYFGKLRRLVMINTVLGAIVILIAVSGSVWS